MFGILAGSNVVASVGNLFTEMTTLLAKRSPNSFNFYLKDRYIVINVFIWNIGNYISRNLSYSSLPKIIHSYCWAPPDSVRFAFLHHSRSSFRFGGSCHSYPELKIPFGKKRMWQEPIFFGNIFGQKIIPVSWQILLCEIFNHVRGWSELIPSPITEMGQASHLLEYFRIP